MANRSRQRSQRRAQIIMGIFAILVILSMVVSLVWFTTPTPSPPAASRSQP
jgi:heme/copper-type cytochrome/quinol oxidase subunit 4